MTRTLAVILIVSAVAAAPRAGALPTVESVTCLTPEGGLMPTFFPDGKRIAYVRPTAEGEQQLWILTIATGEAVRLGEIDAAEWPTVSPDGQYIAYLSGPVFARRIYVADVADGETRALTPKPGFMSRPCWVEGGKRVAFALGRGKQRRVVTVEPAAPDNHPSDLERFGPGTPSFSKDGKFVAMVTADDNGARAVRVLTAGGEVHMEIPQVNFSASGVNPRGCYDPAFSPDERYMAYVRSDLQPASDLYLRDLETGSEIRLTTDRADNQSPAFSPDGRFIAFVATRNSEPHKVYLMALEYSTDEGAEPPGE